MQKVYSTVFVMLLIFGIISGIGSTWAGAFAEAQTPSSPNQDNSSISPVPDQSAPFTPAVSKQAWVDTNNNVIADSFEQEIAEKTAMGTAQDYADVIVMLKDAPTVEDVDAFVAAGGYLTTSLWKDALYGFGGMIKYCDIASFVQRCPDALLVEKEAICNATIAYAAQQIGARTYAWNNLSLQGDPNAAIAIVDSGIDASHTDFSPGYGDQDFAKKVVGWNDQVGGIATPYDDDGHGSHCSGLAAGDGFNSVDGSGNARITWGNNFTGSAGGGWFGGGFMVNKTGSITISVKWNSTGTNHLSSIELFYGDKSLSTGSWVSVASVNTPSQNTFYSTSYNVASTPAGGYDMYHVIVWTTGGTGNFNVVYNMTLPYIPPADGFSAWTGIAPQSKLVGVKVLNNVGSGTTAQILNGINWLVSNRVTYHITVASMSLGFGGEVATVDTALVNLVNSGVSTVVSAGNDGSGSNKIWTLGSVDEVTTVASMNAFDGISSFSSQGGASHSTGFTTKPDITAPGGSHYAVALLSADSNTNDAEGGFAEVRADDAAPMQGTSMACPVVSGATELVVQAMGGYSIWNWTRGQALYPKTILLMTATETYPNLREGGSTSTSPTLNRGGKDVHEGYGRVNVDTALDALLSTYTVGTSVSDTLGAPPTITNITALGQKLAWARNVQLVAGTNYNFTLTVPSGADYDLYLYNTTGSAYGEPVILASSTTAATGGGESLTYTPSRSEQYFIVVKRATETTGTGQFTLTSTPPQTPEEKKFDFGTTTSPVEAGYIRATPSSAYNATAGYGWDTTSGLDARDRGAPDNLRRDFVFSATNHTFKVDLPNGLYQVTITVGDQWYALENINIYAEGILKTTIATTAGTFEQTTFTVSITDGQLNLLLNDNGGATPIWEINALVIEQYAG
jgi:subtilisin family serine protease